MNPKIKPEHLQRLAVIYVRQSSVMQTIEHTESKRRQYALVENAAQAGFVSVETIDDDLGRSASGMEERPGFQRLVSLVCNGTVGAIYCLEASRLARNGRDWHHLLDLCGLVGVLLIDPEGIYDPRLMNDRLLLGLKGTMSEYELNLLQQRGMMARESLAHRGELRVSLPPGYCWNELGRMELDPNERVRDAIALIFRKFDELGSARQVCHWARLHGVQLPVRRLSQHKDQLVWKIPACHNILLLLNNPMYAGAYVFGRTENRIRIESGRAIKTVGHKKPRERWSVLLRDHHPGYITWEDYERHRRMLGENAHMQRRTSRKGARGGAALLTGLVRCGRCGRMMRVMYRSAARRTHRYYCGGGEGRPCVSVGGQQIDFAMGEQLLEVVAPHAVDAAVEALQRSVAAHGDVERATARELQEAQYAADLAARRYEAVDPNQRLVARELEARWEAALERVREIQQKLRDFEAAGAARAVVDRSQLLELAHELPLAWHSRNSAVSIKQRILRILVEEVIVDVDDQANEIVIVIHWNGGRHSETRVVRGESCRNQPSEQRPSAVAVLTRLGANWSDLELAVTLNRMRCINEEGCTWTSAQVRELRERLGLAAFDATAERTTISAQEAARRLSIGVTSVHRLIREGVLPATQVMSKATWQVPISALDSDAVQIGVYRVIHRQPRRIRRQGHNPTPQLPGYK